VSDAFGTLGLMPFAAFIFAFMLFPLSLDSAFAQGLLNDPSLIIQSVVDGLVSPTSLAFLDNNNILFLEKGGNVRLISNGILQSEPLFHIEQIENNNERGLLGIAYDGNRLYLFVTESGAQVEGVSTEGEVRNRVSSYAWDGSSLSEPQLLLDLPATLGANHQGGKLKVGPDKQLYVLVGEMLREGQLQNFQNGPPPDDTGVILRVNPLDGSASTDNPFVAGGEEAGRYYAYGIRNSYGRLLDAENGEDVFDEINLVEHGFNSGWKSVMGPMGTSAGVSESDLVNIPGSHYADPVFSWAESRGLTDIEFLNSTAKWNLCRRYNLMDALLLPA